MSFEVHLWRGIDINENLKMTDIWNIFFSDILSGAIMIRSSSHNQHLAQRYMWTAKCFEKGKQTLPEKVWVMDISPASCLQVLPLPFYMALKRWQGYNSRPSFTEQRKLLFHDPRCFCWQFFAMKVDTSAKRLAGGCLWKMHRPDSSKVSAVEGVAWNARLLLCCVTLNYIHVVTDFVQVVV